MSEQVNNGQQQILEVENSDDDIDDDLGLGQYDQNMQVQDNSQSNAQSHETRQKPKAGGRKGFQTGKTGWSGATMFIDGKPQNVNQASQALNNREKSNWLVHILFIRQEYTQCLKFVDELLEDKSGDKSEYAIYLKALILRIKGSIHDSLELFKKCHLLNPNNIEYLKQFGRSLYLLGRHKQAIELFNECLELDEKDWETYFYKGLSFRYLRQFDEAIEVFSQSNSLHPNENTFLELGKVYQLVQNYQKALEIYAEGLNTYPENPELLTTIGQLYIRLGQNNQAFQYLGNSLSFDQKNNKTILALGSIIQDKMDYDAALLKYRIAAIHNPDSSEMWNNIGMCFYGKKKFVASIACLKKALYLDPFQWIAAFNLGLVHLTQKQYASAFHYFSVAINWKTDFSNSYMYLGITLNKLNDFESACKAFEKAIQLEPNDCTIYLNYAIVIYNRGYSKLAYKLFMKSEEIIQEMDKDSREPEMLEQREVLAEIFGHALND